MENSTKCLRGKKNTYPIQTLPENESRESILSKLFYEVSISWIPKPKTLQEKKKQKKNYRLITLINMDVKLLNKILALIQQHIYTYISYIFIIYIMFIWLISWNKSHFVKCIINPTLTKWDLFQDTTLVKHCTEVLHQCNKAGKGNKEHID